MSHPACWRIMDGDDWADRLITKCKPGEPWGLPPAEAETPAEVVRWGDKVGPGICRDVLNVLGEAPKEGWSKHEIADKLGINYQQVGHALVYVLLKRRDIPLLIERRKKGQLGYWRLGQ